MKNKKLKTGREGRVPDLQSLLEKISKKEGMEEQRGSRRRSEAIGGRCKESILPPSREENGIFCGGAVLGDHD